MSPASAIADFYPATFDIDMNGSRSPWEGVNLLPFVDSGRLERAVADLEHLLTPEEVQRNRSSSGMGSLEGAPLPSRMN